MKNELKRAANLNRRQFVVSGIAGSLVLAAGRPILAQSSKTLRVGFISPRSGALAGFGKADGYVLDEARKALAGGIEIGGKTYAVEILDRDTQSDPSRAGQLAKDLINNEKIDLMLATSTPETVNPVSDACEAAGMPCLSTNTPWEAFYFGRGAVPGKPSPFKWTYHFSFGVEVFFKCYMSQWSQVETNKRLGLLYPNDADGNAMRGILSPRFVEAGYTIIDAGPYETGTTDYSTQIALFKNEGVEIFNTFPIPPDFAAFWRQAAQQGLHRQIKILQVAKTGLFASDIEALGSLGDKVASACYWHRDYPYSSPLTGQTGAELCDGYEALTGEQWNQQIGASMSVIEAGIAALKASSDPKEREAVAKALSTLNVPTMTGPVNFNTGPVANVSPVPLIGTQWVKSNGGKYEFDYVITENINDSNIIPTAKLLPYNS